MRASLALVLALTAGCAMPSTPDGHPPATGPPGDAHAFTWNGCEGFLAVGWFAAGLNPGTPPGGWDDAGGGPTRVGLLGWQCDRVHWDHLERGPVRFLLEVHDDMTVPAACQAGAERTHWTLAGLWTDDGAVADLARAAGLPVHAAPIRRDGSDLETWSWDRSSLTAPAGGDEPVLLPPARLFWDAAGGVHALDLESDAHGSGTNRLATGTFAPPMLLADGPQPRLLTSSGYTRTTVAGSLEAGCA